MINFKKNLILAALLCFSLIIPVQALVLDTFDYGDDNFYHTLLNGTVSVTPFVISPINVLGGGVSYTIHTSVGDNKVVTLSSGDVATGALSISMDSVIGFTESIIVELSYGAYNEIDLPLAIPVDMTLFGSGFYYDVIQSDLGLSVTITVFDDDGMDDSVMIMSFDLLEEDGPVREYLSFGEFSGIDFTKIIGVDVAISSFGTHDLSLSEFGIIPEPAGITILALAILGFAANRRSRILLKK